MLRYYNMVSHAGEQNRLLDVCLSLHLVTDS